MTEIPDAHESVEPMTISTTIVVSAQNDSQQRGSLVHVEHDPDEFNTTDPSVRVTLMEAFDGTRTPDEVAATVISEWIDTFCEYAIGAEAKDAANHLHANLRNRPALFGAFVGFARTHLLEAETEIEPGHEHVYREFRHAVEAFSPEQRACDLTSRNMFQLIREWGSDSGADTSEATEDDEDDDSDIAIESPTAAIGNLDDCDHVWQREYDDIITNDDERVYARTGDRIQAIAIATGELTWGVHVDGEYSRLRQHHSPVEHTLYLHGDGEVLALDAETGERRATIPIDDRISSAAPLDTDRLAVVHAEAGEQQKSPFAEPLDDETCIPRGHGSPKLSVYSLATGDRVADYTALEIRGIDGTLGDRLFFQGDEGGRLTAIDATTGNHVWTVQFESGIVDTYYVDSQSGAGVVACATGTGNVYGLSPTSGRREWVRSPLVARPPDEMRRHDRRTGIDESWGQHSGNRPVRFIDTHEPETLYLVDEPQSTYASLEPDTGRHRWQCRPEEAGVAFPPDFAIIADDTMYVIETVANEEYFAPPSRFTAVDPVYGTQRWQTTVENRFSSLDNALVNGQYVIGNQLDGCMYLSRETGKFDLNETIGHGRLRPDPQQDGVLVGSDGETLYGVAVEVLDE